MTYSEQKPGSASLDDFHEVLHEEKQYLTSSTDEPLYGIAFSGGGIRSASFGMGVMQAMVKHRKLEKMHYMSTVSGGGYLGTALTWALHQEKDNAGTTPENFPLGHKDAQGNKRDNPERNKRLDYIRLHSNYLTPDKLGLLSVASVAVRSIFMSLLVYMLLFVSIMGILVAVSAFDTRYFGELLGLPRESFGGEGIFVPLAMLLTGVYLLLNMYYSLYTKFGSKKSPETKYKYFITTQRLAGLLWKIILLFLLFGLIPFIHLQIDDLNNSGGGLMLAGGSTSFGILVSIWQYWKAQKHDKSSGAISGTMVYLGAFSLIYGLTFIAYLLGQKGIAFGQSVSISGVRFFWPVIFSGSLLLLSFFFGVFVNLNLISPSRIWRNRLMETFMPEPDAVKENKWQPAISADKTLLEDMCQGKNKKPYHLINTNLILANSETVKFRSRGGDNFVLSPLFCGSSATGWCKTDKTHRHFSRRVSLATAMATSAAAVNPNAGVSGEGATRNTIVSVMFIILNIRLGFWMTNPNKKPWKMPPNFFVPGLNGQLFGWGLKETNRNIQLSDGGHFENLGIYELIRRELSVIVVSDGGADPLFNFDDLANAVEKVRVDFGAEIEFRKEYPLSDLLPETETDSANKIFIAKYALAQRGFAVADINYASGKKGTLYYLKLTMVKNLPTDVYSYKGVHPEFPHQSTADQFFDEKQFEAYRELGYKIGCDLFDTKHQETSLVNI